MNRVKNYFGRLFRSRKFWKRLIVTTVIVPVLLFSVVVLIVYWKQDEIVQGLLHDMNEDFVGSIEIKDSHVSMFANFPYISIDLEDAKIYENKQKNTTPIVDVDDIYVGFDIWTVISGDMEIKKIELDDGKLNIIQHEDGEFNIVKALSTTKEIEDTSEEFHLDLKKVELNNIDLIKLNEATNMIAEAYITKAESKFSTSPHHVYASLDAQFELNIIQDGDTTFIKHKHFDVDTEIDYLEDNQTLTIQPTVVGLEDAEFNMEGTVDVPNDMTLDLTFSGNKPNFDLFIAMAPEELIPTLKKYENQGKIFFEANVKGKSMNGNKPLVTAKFGCQHAYFNNYEVNKKLDDLNFVGFFTNGEKRDMSTMTLALHDFSARPEAGKFSGSLDVKNFESPDINLELNSQFELNFLAKFFNLRDLTDLEGKVGLTMKFHDIIDLSVPEKSIEKFNEAYYMKLKIDDLSFKSNKYGVPVDRFNILSEVNGHKAEIPYLNLKMGNSDVKINGSISDLPAIIHHTDIPVDTRLKIKSNMLDLFELTGSDSTAVNEQIQNLSMDLDFKSSARAFTESPNLPVGEFFIENLYAKLKHYPHTFHDFHADIFVENEDFRVVDFKGMIDKSDFFFSGKLKNYDMWFMEHPAGDTKLEFNLTSDLMQLEDLFSYQGENFVPEDYRHEEFQNLAIHGYTDLHFRDGFRSSDMYIDKFEAKMKIHPMRFEKFRGRVHYEDDHLIVENFSGKIGKSDFKTTLHWYLGENEAIRKRDNHFEIHSSRLDIDELSNYNPPPSTGTASTKQVDHDAGFNIYELPFTQMTYDIHIGHLTYHKYKLHNINAKLRTTPNHYIYIDQAKMNAAGGSWDITGYFNGSDPNMIYFSPKMKLTRVDLDKLLFKFDNFGQDHVVAENLHGKFTGTITGKIHMHADFVPKIDDSEIHMDIEVLDGKLENYALLETVSDYFKDKNLKKVLFDTLDNHLDLTNGVLTIPSMDINTSLGHIIISGKQDVNMNMEYYIRIPWKMVTQAATSKLFGKKREEVNPDQVDAIQYADPKKKTRYLNLKITGNIDDYKITLGKEKKKKKSN